MKDIAFGGAHSDEIFGGSGQDVIFGDFGEYSSAIEFLPYQNYRSIIINPDDAGDDKIHGQEGDDIIFGQEGSDYVTGGPGNDDIIGGHSRLYGYDSGDTIEGGDDDDVITGDNAQIFRIRLSSDDTYPWYLASVWKTYPDPFEHSVIRNVSRYDDIDFVQGNDLIYGGLGNDVLHGQRGNDTLNGASDGTFVAAQSCLLIFLTYCPTHSLTHSLHHSQTYIKCSGGDGEDELYGELGFDNLDGGPGNDILIGDVGHAVRRFDVDGNPLLQTALPGNRSQWHKDVVLEDLGHITQTLRISTKVDTNALYAENTTAASLIFIANAYANGEKVEDEAQGGWPTYMILYDLLEGYDDVLTDSEGSNVMIGQRGDDVVTGNGLLIGDAGSSTIPQDTHLPRIYQIYRVMPSPGGSGIWNRTLYQRRNLLILHEALIATCSSDLQSDDPNLFMDVLPPEGLDFGVLFSADFELYPSQYRYVDYLSSFIDSQIGLSDAQVNSHLVKDLIGASTLSTNEGYCLQPMFRITPGFSSPTQWLHGNDVLRSGDGNSIVIGDDIQGSVPFDLTELKAVGDLQAGLDRLVFDLSKRLSTMEVDTKFFLDGAFVKTTDIKVASDTFSTSEEGQAFVVGDFLRLYARTFLGATLSETQVLGMLNRLRDIELVLLDTHIAFYELHQDLLQRSEGLPNMKRTQRPHHDLTLASDAITSMGDGDVVIGDSAFLFTQVDRPGEEGFEFELLSNSPVTAVRDLTNDRDDLRDHHIQMHLNPSMNLSESEALKLPFADVPYLLTACADIIDLTLGNNIAAGDYGFLGFVSSSRAATNVDDAYVGSVIDVVKRPGVASFLSNPVILKLKIPFFYERFDSKMKKRVEPKLFGDDISGSSTENAVLGEFLTAVGSGPISDRSEFAFDERERGVFSTFDNAQFAIEVDGDKIKVKDGTMVDGQKGKDTIQGSSSGNVVEVEPYAQKLFYDHTLLAQWFQDIYNAPVSYGTFANAGIQNPQCVADLFDGFIPPDIFGGMHSYSPTTQEGGDVPNENDGNQQSSGEVEEEGYQEVVVVETDKGAGNGGRGPPADRGVVGNKRYQRSYAYNQ